MSRILVTGADGFIGRALVDFLSRSGDSVVAVVRDPRIPAASAIESIRIADVRTARWPEMLEGIEAVIHLAARAHVLRERSSTPLAEFRAINVRPTIELFRACQAAAVERFIFVSSIGVNGTFTQGHPFTELDAARPAEPYAVSKWEAEESLRGALAPNSTKLTIVRPALVYGPNAKGNFLRLMRWIDAGWPLPFRTIEAKRSFLGLRSLCGLLKRCSVNSFESEQLFLAADDRPVATRDLVAAIAAAMKAEPKQIRIPGRWLSILAALANRTAELERLSTPLEVDVTRARSVLGWTSPALGGDLQDMADAYLRTKNDAA